MAGYQDCITALKKTGENLTDDDIEAILSAVDARAKKLGGSDPKAVMKAAKELAEEDRLAALIEKRNALINAQRYTDLHKFVETASAAGVTPAQALKAMMGGISKPFAGSRLSVDASGKALDLRWRGSLVLKLQKSGLLSAARSGRHDLDIARELYQLTTPNGKIGISGNKTAADLAGILRSHMKIAVDAQNRAGSAIGSLDGYITRQSHDMSKIRRAGYKTWADKMKQLLDVERTFKGADPDDFLHGTYQALTSGIHLKSEGVGGDKLLAFKGPANLAKKLSAERVLHFKDADAFMAYRKEFGRGGTLLEDVAQTLEHSAKSTALMERFGTNPRAMFDRLRSDLGEKNRDKPKVVDKLKAKFLDHLFADISGENKIPGNVTQAQIWSFIRAWNSLSKLGGALFSSVTDLANRAAETRYQGQGLFSGLADGVASVARGRGHGFEREIADINLAGVEGMIGRLASNISADDALPGMMSKTLNTFFRLNGLSWWTDVQKAGAQLMMARHLGKERNKGWDALDEDTTRVLSMYDITKPIWEMIRKEIKPAENGRHYLTVDVAQRVSDLDIDNHLTTKINEIKKSVKDATEKFSEKDRQEKEWIRGRITKLNEMVNRHKSIIQNMRENRTNKMWDHYNLADAQIEVLTTRMQRASIEAELEAGRRGLMDQQAMRSYLDNVEDGRTAVQVSKQTDGRLSKAAGANLSIGQKFGIRLERADARIRDAEAKVKKFVKQSGKEIDVKVKELDEKFAEAMEEFANFSARVKERQSSRASQTEKLEVGIEPQIKRLREEFREKLETNLQAYFSDRADYAVPTPGANERAIMHQGTQPGTLTGEVLRLFGQFKAFPVTIISKIYGRELYGGRGNGLGAKAWNMGSYMLLSTALGALAMSLKDVAKGKVPRDFTQPEAWKAAMLQGGGLGIFGDYMFGQASRFGNKPLETAVGPTGSTIASILDLWARVREGDAKAADALKLAIDNTPFLNLFYVRPVVDYLFLYGISENLNPGFLRKMEKRMAKDNKQHFLFAPSRHAVGAN